MVASFTDDTGQATSQTSAATATVLDVAPTVTTPTITGSDIEGSTLTASATVTADEFGTPSYQWQSNGTDISGATASTYTLTEGDENTTITVVASFTDDTGQATSQTRAATATVLDVAPTVTTPTITGSDIEGSTLTASATVTADEFRHAELPVAEQRHRYFRRHRLHLHADRRRREHHHHRGGASPTTPARPRRRPARRPQQSLMWRRP